MISAYTRLKRNKANPIKKQKVLVPGCTACGKPVREQLSADNTYSFERGIYSHCPGSLDCRIKTIRKVRLQSALKFLKKILHSKRTKEENLLIGMMLNEINEHHFTW